MNGKPLDPRANEFCRVLAAMLIETAQNGKRGEKNAPKRKRAPRANGRRG